MMQSREQIISHIKIDDDMWSHTPNLCLTLFLVFKHFNMSLFSLALQLHYLGNSGMFVGLNKMLDVITLDIFTVLIDETFNWFTPVKKNTKIHEIQPCLQSNRSI